MAISNGYTTVATFQSYTGMSTITADETVNIEKAIESASRSIDRMTNRRFWADANATARQYRATDFYRLFVDDISSTSGLIVKTDTGGDGTFETTLTSKHRLHSRPRERATIRAAVHDRYYGRNDVIPVSR
jgi:signal transduction protein with GAF and PtsI domain